MTLTTAAIALLVLVRLVVSFLSALGAFRTQRLIDGTILPRVTHSGHSATLVTDAPVLDLAVSRAPASEQRTGVHETQEQSGSDQHNEG
jgi:hypothetical protein